MSPGGGIRSTELTFATTTMSWSKLLDTIALFCRNQGTRMAFMPRLPTLLSIAFRLFAQWFCVRVLCTGRQRRVLGCELRSQFGFEDFDPLGEFIDSIEKTMNKGSRQRSELSINLWRNKSSRGIRRFGLYIGRLQLFGFGGKFRECFGHANYIDMPRDTSGQSKMIFPRPVNDYASRCGFHST